MTLELLSIVLIVAACSSSGPKGPGREAWQRARTVAETHLRQSYGEPPAWRIKSEREGTPFLFGVRSPREFAVLVHEDQVFTQRGLGGLDRYLRESRCVEQRTTNVADMMTLMHLFETYPPIERPRDYVAVFTETTAHRPRLDFHDGGRGTLHLFYWPPPTSDDGESEPTDDDVRIMTEWTLTMDPGQMPVWTKRPRSWNPASNKFVDHAD